ncbi:MAG: glycosyltransferase family 4 protein [Desulfatiglandales bacterium]
MQIAFIRREYDAFGGAERYTQAMMAALAERGLEVHLFARQWQGAPGADIQVHRVRTPRRPSLLRDASFVIGVRRQTRRHHFDLIQSNERTLSQDLYRAGDGVHATWLRLRGRLQGPLKRLSVRINPYHRYTLWLERRLFEDPALKAVVVNSNMVRREITDRFRIADNKIHTIYNGTDLDRFHPRHRETLGRRLREEVGVPGHEPVVLFVGSGFERKGLAQLIRAMALAGDSARLWVVGKGDVRPYRSLAGRVGIEGRVRFWGPKTDVSPFYAAADLFAFPSLYDPFPSAVLEALASGLPVIQTATCGTSEITTQGREGFILRWPDDMDDFTGALRACYDPGRRRDMAHSARRTAEFYPFADSVRQMLRLYFRLLNLPETGV